ncbi:MAG: tryptophan--tRNA ligase [Candidatus Bipolaricaulota bacterium]|nr:tryptophan--tRNA ligase [Candidatus Bipolaricaulota bacterium]MCS7275364.1 tryptophan--tRNA ligase [Candidatus Bipolaricaulota bacterium]MDW8110137.1 tryptophan--tRNA ligase [Candidatus Bipolaricaulota bacterium]MDW8329642.1 tryptophan--tRNA ligase [Candidatus Bipolaricaulota bacterium]
MTAIVFSGLQPTGTLHIGNYFGAVQNFVKLQTQYKCYYAIVDYHAITVEHDPEELRRNTLEMGMDLLACGLDPRQCVLFVQSQVPEHTELAWILSAVTSYGDLQRMTQFKEKGEGQEFVSCGLFTYPVLQAADILAYKASKVPVGEDQVQHIELTRRIARRFNSRFGETFPEPEVLLSEALRIMSPAEPTRKMSKSLGPKHYIAITESEDSIREKIKTAVTDIGPRPDTNEKSPGVANLFLLLKLTAPKEIYDQFEDDYARGVLKYEPLKRAVADYLVKTLEPIRARRAQLKEAEVREILIEGARTARAVARRTLEEVRERIGVGRVVL